MSASTVLSLRPNPTPPGGAPQYGDAYQRALPAARALTLAELVTINIDVPTAVTTVIGKLPQVRGLRDAIVRAMPTLELVNIDQLETYTLATAHAHALYLSASAPSEGLARLTADAAAIRDTLYSDAVALANRGLINGARLGEFKAATGYKNVAFDLLGLTALLRTAWSQVEGKTALTLAELDAADLTGEQILSAIGNRRQGPLASAEVVQLRQRMFTLFVNAWGQVRRAVIFLRWDEEDFDEIAPSLYAGRGRRKTDAAVEPPQPPAGGPGPTTAPGTAPETPDSTPITP